MANAVTLWPPTSPAVGRFISDRRAGLISTLYGASLAGGLSPAFIESQRQALALLAKRNGSRVLWNPMPEWDQAGGIWVPNGRPRYLGLTKSQAYTRFSTYYFQACTPLSTYLTQSAAQRGCELAAVTDYPANTFYAYANGVDVCLLERGIDELSDISTGIAFIRGAARQYNKRWGIDIANWRTSNNAPTQFTPQGGLTGGWSPSYLRRHYYIAYMSGAPHSPEPGRDILLQRRQLESARPGHEGVRGFRPHQTPRCRAAAGESGAAGGLLQRLRCPLRRLQSGGGRVVPRHSLFAPATI